MKVTLQTMIGCLKLLGICLATIAFGPIMLLGIVIPVSNAATSLGNSGYSPFRAILDIPVFALGAGGILGLLGLATAEFSAIARWKPSLRMRLILILSIFSGIIAAAALTAVVLTAANETRLRLEVWSLLCCIIMAAHTLWRLRSEA